MSGRHLGTIVVGAIAAAGLIPSVAAGAIPVGNLPLLNPGAEIGPSSIEGGTRNPIPGWTALGATGPMAVDYKSAGDPAPRMHVNDPGVFGCRGFFGGGAGVTGNAIATQTIDVSTVGEIAGGGVTARASARVGRLGGELDHGRVTVEFFDANGAGVGTILLNDGTSATSRLALVTNNMAVPASTKSITISVVGVNDGDNDNFGYVDDVGITLDGSDPSVAVPPAGCNAPGATTGSASNVTASTATVDGAVEPHLEQTSSRFDYGPTTTYGSSTLTSIFTPAATDAFSNSVPASADLTGLTPDTLYHYQLVASTPYGLVQGADMTFQTAAEPPPGVTELDRRLSIAYSSRKHTFSGKIRSSNSDCKLGKVKVFRVHRGRDPKVAFDLASPNGRWSADEEADEGKYYATVGARAVAAGSCPALESRTIKVG